MDKVIRRGHRSRRAADYAVLDQPCSHRWRKVIDWLAGDARICRKAPHPLLTKLTKPTFWQFRQ